MAYSLILLDPLKALAIPVQFIIHFYLSLNPTSGLAGDGANIWIAVTVKQAAKKALSSAPKGVKPVKFDPSGP